MEVLIMFNLVPFDKRNRGLSAADNRSTDMDAFFDSFFRDAFAPAFFAGSRQMKVDIRENDDGYILEADLPGVRKDQVNLEINDDQLVISVTEDEKSESKKEGYICRERRVGTIARSFPLTNIKADGITAALENGILSVTLPKEVPGLPKSRKIDIA